MSIQPTDSMEDVAFKVSTAFHSQGTPAILFGNAAAAIYAPQTDPPSELSFVLPWGNSAILLSLGFQGSGIAGTFLHPSTPYRIEILEGPLSVRNEILTAWETRRREGLVLGLVSPTDCVRQLLAAAMESGEIGPVERAAEVAIHQRVDMDQIQTWCGREDGSQIYALFRHLILI